MDLRTHLSFHDTEHDLRRLMFTIAVTSKYISSLINQSNRKLSTSKNVFGEQQLELDKASDSLILERLSNSPYVGRFASEELGKIVEITTNPGGRYSVVVDPLDGSSLVDVNLSIGTIVGIHDGDLDSAKNLVAAMYILYGPLTTLVYTAKKGTHEFVLTPEGEFVLSEEKIQMKEKGSIYSPGGNKNEWTENHAHYIAFLENEGYKLRYSGGLVPDVNQILMKRGGVFSYPALKNKPKGKLRLFFELQPMALLVAQAGGMATSGLEDILSIETNYINATSPIYLGSSYEVEKAKEFLKN